MVAVAILLGMSACTRSTGVTASNAKPMDVFAAGPSVADVRSLLGDDRWWPAYPTFGVRPLKAASLPLAERFDITQRFLHVGTPEHFLVDYIAWDSSSSATTRMSNVQTQLGTSVSGPKAGDQAFYYASQETSGTALFIFTIFVRVGPVVIEAEWTRTEARPGLTLLGKIANLLAGRLKDVLAGRVHPSPLAASDSALLAPLNDELTLLGAAKLPIEVVATLFSAATPQEVVSPFTNLGVKDLVYADYALNSDVTMEVRAAEFTFADQSQASSWINAFVGSNNLDAEGIFSTYASSLGMYVYIFTSGVHGAMVFCSAAVIGEAASRACENPMVGFISTWRRSLASA